MANENETNIREMEEALISSSSVFGGKDSFVDDDEDYSDYFKDIQSIKNREVKGTNNSLDLRAKREALKESFKPKKPIEEHENFIISPSLKSKLDKIDENVKQVHKENLALGYSIGIVNETIEKLQSDLEQIATRVEKVSKNPLALYNDLDSDELKSYDQKIDEDVIIQNVLFKLKETSPKPKKSGKISSFFSFSKKELILIVVLLFLIGTNSSFRSFVEKFFSTFEVEVATTYTVKKGDKAECIDSFGNKNSFLLKEGEKINLKETNNGKEFLIVTEKNQFKCILIN